MLPSISFLNPLFLSFLFLLIFFLLFLVIIPLKKINSYKQDGIITYFFPALGYFQYLNKSLKEFNDVMGNSKAPHSASSPIKFLVTNYSTKVLIMLKDPQYIKEFLQKQNFYHKSRIARSLQPLAGTGLLIAEDDVWKRHRKVISSSFHYEFLKRNILVMQNTAKEFLEKIQVSEYHDFPIMRKTEEITGEIVGRIFFGEHLNNYSFEGKSLTLALTDITAELAAQRLTLPVVIFGPKLLEVSFIPKYRRLMERVRKFRSLCFEIIQERRGKSNSNSSDFLSSLFATQKSEDPEMRYSDEDIVNEFITFFIAGMDTTGHLIGMAIYNMTQHPENLSQLQAEREMLYNKDQVTSETLSAMEKLHAFLKETLRFHTPAITTFVRQATYDHEILDLKVKKGDLIVPDFLWSAFDKGHFENPQQFDPERWLAQNSKLDPYAFIPFSAGPRNCIGQHLVMMEAKIIISEFLNRFEFALKEGYQLKMTITFLYEPLDKVLINLQPKVV